MYAHYMGRFTEDKDSKRECLIVRMAVTKNIRTISETAVIYPQEIYTSIMRTIQLEWIFLK